MKRSGSRGKRKFWQEHVQRSRVHPGSVASYCREAGILAGSLRYWRKKLAVNTRARGDRKSAFVAVEVSPSPPAAPRSVSRPLPDPKWVAQVILHLSKADLQ